MSVFGTTSLDTLAMTIDIDRSSLGPTPLEVLTLLREAFVNQREPDWCVALNHLSDDNSRLTLIAYVSTHFHELRHGHDLMSTMHGVSWVINCCRFSANAEILLAKVKKWIEASRLHELFLPLDIYAVGSDPQIAHLKESYKAFKSKRAGFQRKGFIVDRQLTHDHLLEASALSVQLSAIYEVFGRSEASEFIGWIRGSPSHAMYLRLLDAATDRIGRPVLSELSASGLLSFIAWCALQGASRPQAPERQVLDPVTFFEVLLEYFTRNGDMPPLTSATGLIEHFCKTWGLMSPAEKIVWNLDYFRQYMRRASVQATSGKFDHPSIDLMKNCIDAYAELSTKVLSEPAVFFPGSSYCGRWAEWPSVPIYFVVDGELKAYMRGHGLLDINLWDMVVVCESIVRLLFEGIGTGVHPAHERRAIEVIEKGLGIQVRDGRLF